MFGILKKKSSKVIIASTLTIVIATVTFAMLSSKNVLADDDVITYDTRTTDNANLNEADKEAISNRLKVINECIEKIKLNVNSINKSVEEIRKQSEYETYPAVRLNVDTPLFGIVSVINNKLKITENVSTMDVAKGYSIKDIIKQNSIKVPSLSVGSFVVLTRDVKFDENITIADADSAILQLFKYINQTNDIKQFLNNQTTKIFQGYILKDKKDSMTDTSNRIDSIVSSLKKIDAKVVTISMLYSDNENYSTYVNKYNSIIDETYSLKNKLKNILITDTDLKSVQKNCATLEASTIDFSEDTDRIYSEVTKDVDLLKMFKSVTSKLNEKKKNIKSYLDNSYKEVAISDSSNTSIGGVNSANISSKQQVYPVISSDSLSNLNDLINKINELIVMYIPSDSYITDIPEEVINKADVINAQNHTELTSEKKIEILNQVVIVYTDSVKLENEFYLNNIDVLLQDTQSKIWDIIKYTDSASLSNLDDIYIDIPNDITNINSKINIDLTINVDIFNNLLIQKNNNLLSLNQKTVKVYIDNNTNNVVNSTRQ